MIYRLVIGLVFCVILCVYSVNGKARSNFSEDLSHLERNFDELYEENYSYFWEILHSNLLEAKRCYSVEVTSRYLELANLSSNNAEFNEFFSESVENLCLSSPKCFNEAKRTLHKSVQIKLNSMLNNPLFIDRESLYKSGCLNAR